ncbi:MAG: AraC family transcriptional regulator [Flavobacteriales bacterium]|nr:AraC family transcriptional regulator [Flavobacteriales bacterium]
MREVAMEVGFENSSHFIQVFKFYYGVSPKKNIEINLSIILLIVCFII